MIEFMNIHTGERRKITRPHQIGAFVNSSDLGINRDRGQDFGWRLAPEVMLEVEAKKNDVNVLKAIQRELSISIEDIKITHILQYMSQEEEALRRQRELQRDAVPEFQSEYENEMRRLREKRQPKTEKPTTTGSTYSKKK